MRENARSGGWVLSGILILAIGLTGGMSLATLAEQAMQSKPGAESSDYRPTDNQRFMWGAYHRDSQSDIIAPDRRASLCQGRACGLSFARVSIRIRPDAVMPVFNALVRFVMYGQLANLR